MAKGILRIYMCLGRYQGHVLPLQSNYESPPLLQFGEGSSCKVYDGPWYDDRIAVRRLGLGRKLTDPGDSLFAVGRTFRHRQVVMFFMSVNQMVLNHFE